MESISGFQLTNKGGFDCAGAVMFIGNDGSQATTERWDYITNPNSQTINPGDKGVAAGSDVQLKIVIAAGEDRTTGKYFNYDPTVNMVARYSITGTTLNSTVNEDGVSPN